jgi:hypothetical protein
MMAVRVDLSGADVRLSAPTMLFEQPFTTGAYITTANYDVTRDGEFVMLRAEPGVPRLTVVLNWTDELRRRLASPR